MSREVDNNEDTLDSRDVIARIRELESERESLADDLTTAEENLQAAQDALAEFDDTEDEDTTALTDAIDEAQADVDKARAALAEWDEDSDQGGALKALQAFEAEAEGYGDWRHGAQLIRDSYFEQYARDTAEELYNVRDASWPYTCIDWEKAAEELKQDYTSAEFDGVTYWMRS